MKKVLIVSKTFLNGADYTLDHLQIHFSTRCIAHGLTNIAPDRQVKSDKWIRLNIPTNILQRVFYKLKYYFSLYKNTSKVDTIHWYYSIDFIEYVILRLAQKKLVVEWVGSEVRIPSVLSSMNKYYLKELNKDNYEYKDEVLNEKKINQIRASKLGAIPIVNEEISLFLDKNLFKSIKVLPKRLDLSLLPRKKEFFTNNTILIGHAPSATAAKGSKYVSMVIKSLQVKGFNIDYVLLQNVPKDLVYLEMAKCDIFIDQLILGAYGFVSLEAMGIGVPTICYIMDDLEKIINPELPIINANVENLEEVLIKLINNKKYLPRIGSESRDYVHKYHSIPMLIEEIFKLY